jgi:hypothetical protein
LNAKENGFPKVFVELFQDPTGHRFGLVRFDQNKPRDVIDLVKQASLSRLTISFVLFCMLTLIKTFQYYLLTTREAMGLILR